MITRKRIPVYGIPDSSNGRRIKNFKVASFGRDSYKGDEMEDDRRHEYFEIIWLRNGTGMHPIDMLDHFYEGSVLFFLAPGQVHKITEHKNSEGYTLKFLPAVFKQERDFIDFVFETCLVDTEKSCPVIGIPETMNDVLQELFFRFTEEFNNSSQTRISSWVHTLKY